MITGRTHTYPGFRPGYLCQGKATSANTGIISITVKGRDCSSKIVGLSLLPVYDEAAKVALVQVTSIAYANSVTTILARVFASDDITSPAFTLTDGIVVHYSFWVNEDDLPSVDTNDTDPEAIQ